jgi:hypothetical protein
MKIEPVAHDLPELTEEQRKQQEEPRRPHGHSKNHRGHGKPSGHKPGGGRSEALPHGDPHAPAKRNGSRPHWHRGKDKKRESAA